MRFHLSILGYYLRGFRLLPSLTGEEFCCLFSFSLIIDFCDLNAI